MANNVMKTRAICVGVMMLSMLKLVAQPLESFTDERDGKIYKAVHVGAQIWMAENLNYETEYSWCIECETYGRVYSFETASQACPTGWHLPSDGEWTTLIATLGGFTIAGGKLKEAGYTHWKSPNKGATNESGFNAIPHGYRSLNGILNFENKIGYWWTSTADSDMEAWSVKMESVSAAVNRTLSARFVGLSVRCVKDN
jgi:uncharacterized protein (TIGR02145 family)